MKKYNLFFIVSMVVVSCGLWASVSFASLGSLPVPDVTALTVDEAHEKYGVNSDYEFPLFFEVNAKMGPQKCVSIGPDCSFACPTPKIYTQSSLQYLNEDRIRTIRVDVYYDISEPITFRKPSC